LAADAASEEMVPHLNIILSLKFPLTSQPILLQKIFDDKNKEGKIGRSKMIESPDLNV
jgi:hypothetical protein